MAESEQKVRFRHALANLSLVKQAFYRDSLSDFVTQNSGCEIFIRWPQSRKIIISPLRDMPFRTTRETELQDLCKLQKQSKHFQCVMMF